MKGEGAACAAPSDGYRKLNDRSRVFFRSTSRQRDVESNGQENRHLRTRDRIVRSVVTAAAASGDPPRGQILDPGVEDARAEYVVENRARAGGWKVSRALAGLQKEGRHLGPAHRRAGTVVSVAAAAGDAPPGQVLDPGVEGPGA